MVASRDISSYSTRYSASQPCCTAQLSSTLQQLLVCSSRPAQVSAFSSSFQNSLLLAYVRGFLEPSGPESCADASRTFQNISRASDHVRTPFLDPEHPDMQSGTCSPANAAWPQFRIRHPDLDSFDCPPDSPTYGDPWKPFTSHPNMSARAIRDMCRLLLLKGSLRPWRGRRSQRCLILS